MSAQTVPIHVQEVIIRKDAQTRYGVPLILGALLLLFVLVVVLGLILQPGVPVIPARGVPTISIVCLISVAMSLYFLGPCELRLDQRSRRYRFTCGLPLLARTVHGSYDDIKAIVIRPHFYRGQASMGNQLDIEWNVAGRKTTTLRYLTVQTSYEIRDEIQNKAGFPVQWET